MIVRFLSLSTGRGLQASRFFISCLLCFYCLPNRSLFSNSPRFDFTLFISRPAPRSQWLTIDEYLRSVRIRDLHFANRVHPAPEHKQQHRYPASLPANLRHTLEATAMPPSFLFIVNELPTNDDPDVAGSVPPRMDHGRYYPPVVAQGFLAQTPGHVFRWRDGLVSLAEGYIWSLQPDGYAQGRIYANSLNTGVVWPEYYRTATVFYCNHFAKFFTARGDTSTRDSLDPEDSWHPLSFFHENSNVSYVDHSGDQEFLAVRHASWIEQLLPNTYRRHSKNGPASGGLAGLLPIVIALVAFSCLNRDELYRVLINDRAWRGHRWVPHERETGREYYPIFCDLKFCQLINPGIERRGIVVTVYLDPENPESTLETIADLETGPIPIFR